MKMTVANNNFLSWFVGFCDGESSFNLQKSQPHGRFCRFIITLRQDDSAILEEIRNKLQIGNVYFTKEQTRDRAGAKPGCRFVVNRVSECLKLIDIFDSFPLQTKKKRDYLIWKEAVLLLANSKKGNRWHGRNINTEERFNKLANDIKEVRAYV